MPEEQEPDESQLNSSSKEGGSGLFDWIFPKKKTVNIPLVPVPGQIVSPSQLKANKTGDYVDPKELAESTHFTNEPESAETLRDIERDIREVLDDDN
jgi:hypothetical protein